MADDPHKLEYASPTSPDGRTSRLTIAAMIVSFFSCPWFWAAATDHVRPRGLPDSVVYAGMYAVMAVATGLAVVALVRVRRSRGRLRGAGIAGFALAVSLLWWTCLGAVFAAVSMWASS